jgi:uncharacterized protein (DUF302 family)
MAPAGFTQRQSAFSAKETADRLAAALKAKGLTLFARVDHAAGAAAVHLPLRPTEVFIFGNAKGGTPLMQAAQTAGIDLPLKALIWEDAEGKVWLGYNDPAWVAERHGAGSAAAQTVTALSAALAGLAKAATDG